jgi:hypothetical protein
MSTPNYRAMQVAATIQKDKSGNTVKLHARPGDVLARYMAGGAWRADLSRTGAFRPKGNR